MSMRSNSLSLVHNQQIYNCFFLIKTAFRKRVVPTIDNRIVEEKPRYHYANEPAFVPDTRAAQKIRIATRITTYIESQKCLQSIESTSMVRQHFNKICLSHFEGNFNLNRITDYSWLRRINDNRYLCTIYRLTGNKTNAAFRKKEQARSTKKVSKTNNDLNEWVCAMRI